MMSSEKSVGRATSRAAGRSSRSAAPGHVLVLVAGAVAEHVLDEDDGAVDDDAEVDRAHREQVGRHAAHVEVDEAGRERERDDERRR